MWIIKLLVHCFFLAGITGLAVFTYENLLYLHKQRKLGLSMSGSVAMHARTEAAKSIALALVFVCGYGFFLAYKGTPVEETTSQTASGSAYTAAPARSTYTSAAPSPPDSVTTTLDNYRYRGDSVRITCSGPTGSIVCKPAN